MYQHVVVPLDGSPLGDSALDPGAALARQAGAHVVLYTQVERDAEADGAEARLKEVAAGLPAVATETSVSPAESAAAGIEQAARSLDDAIVCMSTHGRGGVGRSLLGSVAEDVLARLGGPLVLVGPHAAPDRFRLEGPLIACGDG
jgi:nucleotide-binding universal stress UspA family protein